LHGPTVFTHISSKWNRLLQSCAGTLGKIYLILHCEMSIDYAADPVQLLTSCLAGSAGEMTAADSCTPRRLQLGYFVENDDIDEC